MFIHDFNPVLVDFGIFQIKWYSLSYILGIIIGWIYALKIISLTANNRYHFHPIKKSQFDELITYIILGIILGGRIGYIIFYNFNYYSQNPLEVFKIWQGGMSFHGGLFGVIVSTIIYSIIISFLSDNFEIITIFYSLILFTYLSYLIAVQDFYIQARFIKLSYIIYFLIAFVLNVYLMNLFYLDFIFLPLLLILPRLSIFLINKLYFKNI